MDKDSLGNAIYKSSKDLLPFINIHPAVINIALASIKILSAIMILVHSFHNNLVAFASNHQIVYPTQKQ